MKKKPSLKMKYFVLNPNKDTPEGEASRSAIKAYADKLQEIDKEKYLDFAYALRLWMITCEGNIMMSGVMAKLKTDQ